MLTLIAVGFIVKNENLLIVLSTFLLPNRSFMKELLLFFIFLLLPTIAIAQFNNYEQDSKKLDRILANKDEDKAEILKESLNIMRNMLDATFDEVVTPENTEDLKLQLATYRILASIYKKTAQQIPLFKERIALGRQ